LGRQKNALTEYHVAALVEGVGQPSYKQLARYIKTVTDDSDEETDDQAWYDGDGTPEEDIVSVKKKYTFEGVYDEEDPAMRFIAGLEFETGDSRKIMFKQVRTNGDTYEGEATVSGIKVTGGEAAEYAAFECAIAWNRRPKLTPAATPTP